MKRTTLLLAIFIVALFQSNVKANFLFPSGEDVMTAVAKTTMLSVVHDTKSIFKKGMTEAAFLDVALSEIPKDRRSPEIVNYFKKVYFYLNKGYSDEMIFNQENGQTLIDLNDLATSRGEISKAFFKDKEDPGALAFRPFKRWLRLIILILNYFLGI